MVMLLNHLCCKIMLVNVIAVPAANVGFKQAHVQTH